MREYKTAGSIRAGFEYQDLVAIETLIDFYRDRTRYAWVKVEAEDKGFRAIDDVVACRPDGRYELTQVKFAVDPQNDRTPLGWEWLLVKKPRGTSMLQKWFATTLAHHRAGTLASAKLRTGRIPDAGFAASLAGKHIDYDRVAAVMRARLEAEVGPAAELRLFFGLFEFHHSEPHRDDLAATLWARIASDTDSGGWALFQDQVAKWATRKNLPAPDGRIRYIHLQQAFAVERPTPIPQGFRVPDDYSVPDRRFDDAFVARVSGSDGVTVLWGPPGRGKSTYLSHCVERIDSKRAVCIRHHYFLSFDDRSEGRFHVQAIARSLEHQLQALLSTPMGGQRTIRLTIEAAAKRLAAAGQRLVIVIDGLDHVWREKRDHEQMEELFESLLPLPANCHLVVGTQKIATQHLPARLLAAQPVEEWLELPTMSVGAVRKWVAAQHRAGRLHLAFPDQPRELGAVANAFHKISGGLPLHLIYSFEAVARSGEAVTEREIARLPPCPTGDIRDYYRGFLDHASPRAAAVLHLLAGLRFGPPPFALRDCLGSVEAADATVEIGHLLDIREAEIRPFHGSLFAFLRELPGHDAIFADEAAPVAEWLETKAPRYWRDAWLWVTRAQLGDDIELITRPDRAWAIDFLVKGYPIDQLTTILAYAEDAAFAKLDLPRLLALRSLKTRAYNGPEFQTTEASRFTDVAIALTDDPVPAALLRMAIGQVPTPLLPLLVATTDPADRARMGTKTIAELNERIAQARQDEIGFRGEIGSFAAVAAGISGWLDPSWAKRIVRFAKANGVADAALSIYARTSLQAGSTANVFAAARLWSGPTFGRDLLAALAEEGIAPDRIPGLKGTGQSAIRVLALLLGSKPAGTRRPRDLTTRFARPPEAGEIYQEIFEPVLYDAYFDCLAARLQGKTKAPWSHFSPGAKTDYAELALPHFEAVATFVADVWLTERRWPGIGELYGRFNAALPSSRGYDSNRQLVAVRLALAHAAFDHMVIGRALAPDAAAGESDLRCAAESPFWLDELWIDLLSERRHRLLTPEAAAFLFAREKASLDADQTEFNQRADAAVKLATFAADNGLADEAAKELAHAYACLLGYGWRKDIYVFEVLEALELMLAAGDADARDWLVEIAGPVEQILGYTDGRETRHAPPEYHRLLLDYRPDKVAGCFEALVEDGDWDWSERLLRDYAKRTLSETPAGEALLSTFVTAAERRTLFKAASPARPHAAAAAKAVLVRSGTTRDAERRAAREEARRDSSSPGRKRKLPDFRRYPPGELDAFLAALRRRFLVGEGLTAWLDYWNDAGQGDAALADLDRATSGPDLYFFAGDALDRAAEIALARHGRSRAFDWLVRAQIVRNGWGEWFSSGGETRKRLDFVATHFRRRWEEFLRKTAKPVFGTPREGSITVGYAKLVYFLLQVGETDRAKACTRAMIDIFLEEVAAQPIRKPEWA